VEFSPNAFTTSKLANLISAGYPISVGKYTYGGPRLHWSNHDFEHALHIGAFCSIADDVSIFVGRHGRHNIDRLSSFPIGMVFGKVPESGSNSRQPENLSVKIGNDVWIGRGALILAGVTIGDGAVIGARAVVTNDVEPYSVVAGVPAKVLRMRFGAEVVEKLKRIRWWEWSDEKIRANLFLFGTNDFAQHLDALKE